MQIQVDQHREVALGWTVAVPGGFQRAAIDGGDVAEALACANYVLTLDETRFQAQGVTAAGSSGSIQAPRSGWIWISDRNHCIEALAVTVAGARWAGALGSNTFTRPTSAQSIEAP